VAALEPALEVKNDAFVPSVKLDDIIDGLKKTSESYQRVNSYLRKRDFEPLRVQTKKNYQAFAYRRVVGSKHMLVMFQDYRRVNKKVMMSSVNPSRRSRSCFRANPPSPIRTGVSCTQLYLVHLFDFQTMLSYFIVTSIMLVHPIRLPSCTSAPLRMARSSRTPRV